MSLMHQAEDLTTQSAREARGFYPALHSHERYAEISRRIQIKVIWNITKLQPNGHLP